MGAGYNLLLPFYWMSKEGTGLQVTHVSEVGLEYCKRMVRRELLQDNPEVEGIVRGIIARVKAEGDIALLELGRKFDNPDLASLEVDMSMCLTAYNNLDVDVRRALEKAAANIRDFHQAQRHESWMDVKRGRVVGQLIRPLSRVGVYIPGGTAAYPSTVLMTAIPARAAGVQEIVMCSPSAHPAVLAAAHIAGVDRIFLAGGAQAIAAMALGTETVPVVDKIVGPGNVFVNVAKKLLWGVVDMDMLAGPSEVCVLADSGADPECAAMDLLTQVEHDAECAGYLITPSLDFANRVLQTIEQRLEHLPRKFILKGALDAHGMVFITHDLEEACELANACAPEHLALMVRDPFATLGSISNAGAILMGDYSPQTLGDYWAGPSHTLPTSGTARFSSPLHTGTFVKKSSFIYFNPAELAACSTELTVLARAEGFEAHAQAVEARKNICIKDAQ